MADNTYPYDYSFVDDYLRTRRGALAPATAGTTVPLGIPEAGTPWPAWESRTAAPKEEDVVAKPVAPEPVGPAKVDVTPGGFLATSRGGTDYEPRVASETPAAARKPTLSSEYARYLAIPSGAMDVADYPLNARTAAVTADVAQATKDLAKAPILTKEELAAASAERAKPPMTVEESIREAGRRLGGIPNLPTDASVAADIDREVARKAGVGPQVFPEKLAPPSEQPVAAPAQKELPFYPSTWKDVAQPTTTEGYRKAVAAALAPGATAAPSTTTAETAATLKALAAGRAEAPVSPYAAAIEKVAGPQALTEATTALTAGMTPAQKEAVLKGPGAAAPGAAAPGAAAPGAAPTAAAPTKPGVITINEGPKTRTVDVYGPGGTAREQSLMALATGKATPSAREQFEEFYRSPVGRELFAPVYRPTSLREQARGMGSSVFDPTATAAKMQLAGNLVGKIFGQDIAAGTLDLSRYKGIEDVRLRGETGQRDEARIALEEKRDQLNERKFESDTNAQLMLARAWNQAQLNAAARGEKLDPIVFRRDWLRANYGTEKGQPRSKLYPATGTGVTVGGRRLNPPSPQPTTEEVPGPQPPGPKKTGQEEGPREKIKWEDRLGVSPEAMLNIDAKDLTAPARAQVALREMKAASKPGEDPLRNFKELLAYLELKHGQDAIDQITQPGVLASLWRDFTPGTSEGEKLTALFRKQLKQKPRWTTTGW